MKFDFGVIHNLSFRSAEKRNIFLALFFGAFLLLSNSVYGQSVSSWRIDESGNYTSQQLTDALKGVKLDAYRKLNSETKLYFDEGTILILSSGQALINDGQTVNQAILLPEDAPDRPDRKFAISSTGWLLEAIPTHAKK